MSAPHAPQGGREPNKKVTKEAAGAVAPAADPAEKQAAEEKSAAPAAERAPAGQGAERGAAAPEAVSAAAKEPGAEGPAGESVPDLRYKNAGEALKAALLGACIGLAVIVPGVSGAAVAILFGLYEKLLFALGNILRRFRSCILFLLPVALGGAVGLAVGFFAVRALLGICPFAVVALFAGLMLGAYPAVTDNLRGEKRTPARILLFAAGVALPVALGLAAVFASPGSLWPESIGLLPCLLFLLLGFLVALTQVVPGLSATALLMLVGCFAPLLDSVSLTYWRQNPAVFLLYGCLAVGFLAGLVLCSKGIGRLLARRRAPAFFAIGGLSLGSFASMFFNPEIFEVYRGWAEGAPFAADLWSGVLLFAAGLAAAYVLVRFERKKNGK